MSSAKKRKPRARVTVTQTQRHAWVWRVFADPALSHPAKDVALVLGLLYFNDRQNGRCNPGYTGIAKATCWARSVVVEAVEELVVGGWISFTSVGGGTTKNTNRYTIHWSRSATRRPGDEPSAFSQHAAADSSVATRVSEYDAANPGMSIRQVAKALRTSKSTVERARRSVPARAFDDCPIEDVGQGQPIDIIGDSICPIFDVGQLRRDTDPSDIIDENSFEGSGSRTPRGPGAGRVREPDTNHLLSLKGKEVCGDALRSPSPAATAHSRSPLVDKFQQLLELWRNPNGTDKVRSRDAFLVACDDGADPDAILAMAKIHVAAMASEAPRFFRQLDGWLAKGLWLHDPINRDKSGKRSNKKRGTGDNKAVGNKTTDDKNVSGGNKTRHQEEPAARKLLYLKFASEQEEQVLAFESYVEKFNMSEATDAGIFEAWDVDGKFNTEVWELVEKSADADFLSEDPVRKYADRLYDLSVKLNEKLNSTVHGLNLSMAIDQAREIDQRAKPLAVGDRVAHKMFGAGTALEAIDSQFNVRFDCGSPRKVHRGYLERLLPKDDGFENLSIMATA
jgi:hypothetical protein